MGQTNTMHTTDRGLYADEDEVLDAWLASLGPREFEHVLNRLADDRSDALSRLDPTA